MSWVHGGTYAEADAALVLGRGGEGSGLEVRFSGHVRTSTLQPGVVVVTVYEDFFPGKGRSAGIYNVTHPAMSRTLLDEKMLSTGDLSQFDTIVVGIRASQVRPDYVSNNSRLTEFMRSGGTLIVQYNKTAEFNQAQYVPYPALVSSNRVTDETAPVTVLEPAHPLFRSPNAIGPDDWAGWMQERGLYFAREWAAAYAPLLEMGDPGGAPLRGGLLVAPVGRGTYVYTGISFFRQLPAGVPGAFRLFLNLLNLRAQGAR